MSSLSSKFSSFQIWRPVQIWEIFGQTSRVVLLGSVTQTVRCQCMLPWYGMLWCGCGIWYNINWYTMVWQKHGMAIPQYGNTTVAWCGMVWYGMMWHGGVAPRDANSARTRRWLEDPLCYFCIYTTINIIIAYISLNFASHHRQQTHHHCRHLPPHHRLSCRWPVEGLLQLLVAEGNLTSSAVFGRRTLDNTLLWSFAV